MSRVSEDHLLEWRDELLATGAFAHHREGRTYRRGEGVLPLGEAGKKLPTSPAAEVEVVISDKHQTKMRGFTPRRPRPS